MYRIFLITILLLTNACTVKSQRIGDNKTDKTSWSEADEQWYAHRNDKSEDWNMGMFEQDVNSLAIVDSIGWPTKVAISPYPSPVAPYRKTVSTAGYALLGPARLNIEGRVIHGFHIGYSKDEYRAHLFTNEEDYYFDHFNIYILSNLVESESRAAAVISRNYPHFLSTGKQKTKQGSIDWVQMTLAGGDSFAIISQRYFNLKYGRTILVAPQKDGSLRFMQIEDSPGSYASVSNDPNAALRIGQFKAVQQRLEGSSKVVEFFTNEGVLTQ